PAESVEVSYFSLTGAKRALICLSWVKSGIRAAARRMARGFIKPYCGTARSGAGALARAEPPGSAVGSGTASRADLGVRPSNPTRCGPPRLEITNRDIHPATRRFQDSPIPVR